MTFATHSTTIQTIRVHTKLVILFFIRFFFRFVPLFYKRWHFVSHFIMFFLSVAILRYLSFSYKFTNQIAVWPKIGCSFSILGECMIHFMTHCSCFSPSSSLCSKSVGQLWSPTHEKKNYIGKYNEKKECQVAFFIAFEMLIPLIALYANKWPSI